jgi:HMG box factor
MNAPVAIDQSNLAAPCLQVSFSAESSRRGSQRQVPPEKESEKPTPSSPRTRLTKKRAASLNTDAANEPEIGDPALNSARSSGSLSESMRYQVCLCQPDPKIPRPRNGA